MNRPGAPARPGIHRKHVSLLVTQEFAGETRGMTTAWWLRARGQLTPRRISGRTARTSRYRRAAVLTGRRIFCIVPATHPRRRRRPRLSLPRRRLAQLNGSNVISPLDTTTLANGPYTLTAIATDSAGSNGTSPGVAFAVNNPSSFTTPLLTGAPTSSLGNDFSGFVGLNVQGRQHTDQDEPVGTLGRLRQ